MNRRRFLTTLTTAAVARLGCARGGPRQDDSVSRALWTGNVVVPKEFLGIHAHSYPTPDPTVTPLPPRSPPPTYGFSYFRLFGNYAGMMWELSPRQGVFNFGPLDQIIDGLPGGTRVIWCVYGSAWNQASFNTTATNQATSFNSLTVRGPFGQLGECCYPADHPLFEGTVVAILQHYVDRGTPIWGVECWNEPEGDGTYGPYLVAGRNPGNAPTDAFFWGTAGDLARIARSVKNAVRATNWRGYAPAVLLGPAFTNSAGAAGAPGVAQHISDFLNAPDGYGTFGRSHIDGVSYHPYGLQLPDGSGSLSVAAGTVFDVTRSLRQALQRGGLAAAFPLYASEWGISGEPTDPAILQNSDGWKRTFVGRQLLGMAAAGWQSSCIYSHDDQHCGNPSTSPAISQMLRQFNQTIPGSTITRIDLMASQQWLATSSGGQYLI